MHLLVSPHGIAMPKDLYFTVVFSSFFLFSTPNPWGHWADLNLRRTQLAGTHRRREVLLRTDSHRIRWDFATLLSMLFACLFISYAVHSCNFLLKQDVALTRRNTTGPPYIYCFRGTIIRLEAAWHHRLACVVEAACGLAVEL